ncbi:hypothetical protein KSP40_PGU014274 [Platanthera guangdongensis]|uniref:Uncharacterized protein n=1 Tax=Platanthera guangdongensis TaxID=2320717 RepID=A0ABR2MGL4_9ASPA
MVEEEHPSPGRSKAPPFLSSTSPASLEFRTAREQPQRRLATYKAASATQEQCAWE